MKSQFKIKVIILLAIVILIALFGLVGFQLYKIHKYNSTIKTQQEQISSLQNQLDYYKDKLPKDEHDSITGESI